MYVHEFLTLGLLTVFTTQGDPSIKLNSSVHVTSGGEVCPSVTVEFTCIATEVSFLNWFRNGMKIGEFDAGDTEFRTESPPYTFILDTRIVDPMSLSAKGNFTSRLVVNLSNLMSGDNISCSQLTVGSSFVLDYQLRGPPPAPSGYIISFGEATAATVPFNFTWDSTFNSRHAITSYRVVPANHGGPFVIECPSSCPPDVPCRCIGLRVGDQVQVNISAINCDDQEGPVRIVTVASSCEAGDLGEAGDNVTNSECGTSSSVSITNGVGCFRSVATGSVVTYQCDEGYSLSGDFQRTCQSNGSWNGSVPQCTVFITDANIGFLASSVVLWVLSVVLTVIGPVTMVIRKVSFTWQHMVYIILLVIEGLILLVVVILWIVFGANVGNPNRAARSLQNSTIIAAFALSLTSVIWIIAAVVFVHIKMNSDFSPKNEPNFNTPLDSEDFHGRDPVPFTRTELSEKMYDRLSHDPKVTATFVEDTQPPESVEYGQLELEVNDKPGVEDNDQMEIHAFPVQW